MAISLMSKTITSSALTHVPVHSSVFGSVFVPLRAMSFGPLPLGRVGEIPAAHIDFMTDGFKVIGSNAMACSTSVVDFDTDGKRAVQMLENPSVGTNGAATTIGSGADAEAAVTIGIDESCPQPTIVGFLDFRPEPLFDGNPLFEWSTSRHVAIVP